MSGANRARRLWRRGQRGWPERFPLAQLPNPPLVVALGGGLLAMRTSGSVQTGARATFHAALSVWAWKELTGGVNLVRRALGAAGFAYIAAEIGRTLRRAAVNPVPGGLIGGLCESTLQPPSRRLCRPSRPRPSAS